MEPTPSPAPARRRKRNPIPFIAKHIGTGCRRAFCFSGRAPRAEFWLLCLLWWVVLPQFAEPSAAFLAQYEEAYPWLTAAPVVLLLGFMVLSTLSAAARRLHDAGRSRLWLLPALGMALVSVLHLVLCTYIESDTLLVTLNLLILALDAASAALLLYFLTRPSAKGI